jgi:hypothetical protein
MAIHSHRTNLKPGPAQHELQRIGREVRHVPRQIQSPPITPEPFEGKTVDVWSGDDDLAVSGQKSMSGAQCFQGLMDVLQGMPHGNDVKAGVSKFVVRQGADQGAQAQLAADAPHRGFGRIDSGDLPTALVHAQKKVTVAAAEIEQSALALQGKAF